MNKMEYKFTSIGKFMFKLVEIIVFVTLWFKLNINGFIIFYYIHGLYL